MLIFAIDPGTAHSGAVLYDSMLNRVQWSDKALHNQLVVDHIGVGAAFLGGRRFIWDAIVLEALSPRGQVVGWSTFDTVLWLGRMYQAGQKNAATVDLMHRDDIKRTLLGRTNIPGADKHIRQVLTDRVGPKGKKADPGPTFGVSSHAWAALAAAVAWLDKQEEGAGAA